MYTNVDKNFLCNSPTLETTCISFGGWMVVHSYQGLLVSKKKGINYCYMQQLEWISRKSGWTTTKNANLKKLHVVPFIKHSWNDKITELENRLLVARYQAVEGGAGNGCDNGEVAWGNHGVSWLWWWLHKSTHVIKLHRTIYIHTPTYTSAYKTSENWILAMDCANVNFLALILYYHYVKTLLLGESRWMEHRILCTIFATSDESIVIFK